MDPEIKNLYGEEYFQFKRNDMVELIRNSGSADPDAVPEAMFHALTAAKPRYRYKVGNAGTFAMVILERLHESNQDAANADAGVKLIAGAPKVGGKAVFASSRYHKDWFGFGLGVAVALSAVIAAMWGKRIVAQLSM